MSSNGTKVMTAEHVVNVRVGIVTGIFLVHRNTNWPIDYHVRPIDIIIGRLDDARRCRQLYSSDFFALVTGDTVDIHNVGSPINNPRRSTRRTRRIILDTKSEIEAAVLAATRAVAALRGETKTTHALVTSEEEEDFLLDPGIGRF